jgi:UDP-GlcNAc:undecaprenyl-phosphate GlcNAc-1-phosphate transferase
MEYAVIGIAAFVLGLIFTPLAMKAAVKLNIVDTPRGSLKSHKAPVPYLGGAAVYLAFVIPVIAAKVILHQTLKGVLGIIAGASIMVVMGLIDDMKDLTPYVKLAVQLVVSLILIWANMTIKFMDQNVLNIILTIIWVVGITNAMNLLDIMDGLASGVASVASIAFFIVAYLSGRANDMIPAVALFGALCAFLVFNWTPAKIYLGDAGSLFIGFMMASLALNESYSRTSTVAVLSPLLILGVPIFDTMLVSMIRIGKGILPIYGSNDHTAQRLVMMFGFEKKYAVIFLISLTAALSTLAIISTFLPDSSAIILYLGVSFAGMMFAMLIASIDMKNYHKAVHKKK